VKVVLFSSAYAPAVGGVEELTHRLARQLQTDGDEVEVWTNRHPRGLAESETIAGVLVRRFVLPLPRMDLGALAGLPVAAARSLARLRRAARAARPDVLHVQCFSANGIYGTALAALLDVPLVVSLQGETVMDDADIYEASATLRVGLRVGLRRAQAVTACSRFVLDDAEERFGLPPHTGTVIPNGVSLDRAEPQVPIEVPFDRFVLALGRMVEKKGFDLLINAFARVAESQADVGLVIGGDGRARRGLVELVDSLGLTGRVLFPGTMTRAQVAWAMERAAIFALPSRVEPFGIVVLEALRAGRPVIVSARGGAGEIVRDQREGLVVDPFDVEALAAALLRLLGDEVLCGRLGAAGAARVERFSWERIVGEYREIYRGVT
jgi:glycogen synthase